MHSTGMSLNVHHVFCSFSHVESVLGGHVRGKGNLLSFCWPNGLPLMSANTSSKPETDKEVGHNARLTVFYLCKSTKRETRYCTILLLGLSQEEQTR